MNITPFYRVVTNNKGIVVAFEAIAVYRPSECHDGIISCHTELSNSEKLSLSLLNIRKVINDLPLIKSSGIRVVAINLLPESLPKQYIQLLKILIRYAKCLGISIWCETGESIMMNKVMRHNIEALQKCGALISMGEFNLRNRLNLIRIHWLAYDFIKVDESVLMLAMQNSSSRNTVQKVIDRLSTGTAELICEDIEQEHVNIPCYALHST